MGLRYYRKKYCEPSVTLFGSNAVIKDGMASSKPSETAACPLQKLWANGISAGNCSRLGSDEKMVLP